MNNLLLILKDHAYIVAAEPSGNDRLVQFDKAAIEVVNAIEGRWILNKDNEPIPAHCTTVVKTGRTHRTVFMDRLIRCTQRMERA